MSASTTGHGNDEQRARVVQPVLAGLIAAVVGFASTFTVVLAGLGAVGASPSQAESGLFAICLVLAVLGMTLSWHTRMPISIAWSTPGAALLVSTGAVDGGYAAAIGAFAVAGSLTVVAGLWPMVGRWVAAIPAPFAQALLAGVLLPICLSPAKAVVAEPEMMIPVVAAWLLMMRVARRWTVPVVVVVAAIAVAFNAPADASVNMALPRFDWITPTVNVGTMIGLGVPLFIVTMASQNVAGMVVLRSFGYQPRFGPLLVTTGAATAVTAPLGVHGVNLAALSAAMVAGPEAEADHDRRWIAGCANGFAYLLLGLFAGIAASLVSIAPLIVVSAVAGLALLPALTGALAGAMADASMREGTVIVIVVSASGITAGGISGPFWGLAAGLTFHAVQRWGRPGTPEASSVP
ncbi:MAG TPA: benzoate/H(+) symporter BenE family transporter [Ilumatobacter sp.]|nr:benzoate/H(+) symporter BenE family transporter [Ilumatobacter sp.]